MLLPSPGSKWDARSQAESHQILMQADQQNIKRGRPAELEAIIMRTGQQRPIQIIGSNTSGTQINIAGPAASVRDLVFSTGTVEDAGARWILRANAVAESGSQNGSNLELIARNDDGSFGSRALLLVRSTREWRFTGNLIWEADNTYDFGASASGRARDIHFARLLKTSISASRYVQIAGETQAQVYIRFDDNTIQDSLIISNADGTSTSFGSRIVFKRGHTSGGTEIEAGAIRIAGEQVWTSTASTQDGTMIFYVALDGALQERLRVATSGIRVSGSIDFTVDNTWDIGTSGNNPRRVIVSTDYMVGANRVVNARKTGWGTATGTATRTTFATDTVTLIELARRVKALIDDLHATAGHGLIGA